MSVRTMVRVWVGLVVAAIALSLWGCADSAVEPQAANVAGVYNATAFTLGTGAAARDALGAGAAMRLVLKPDGTTSGTLELPAAVTGDVAESFDLAGSWTLSGATVWLETTADGFARDMAWKVGAHRLDADDALDGRRVRITLAK